MLQRSQESWKLISQGLREPRHFQQTLVHEAQQSQNRTAISLLRTQKEWNDMRYYGMAAYLRQKMPLPSLVGAPSSPPWKSPFSTSTTTTTGAAASNTGAVVEANPTPSSPATPPVAKVAFMVTGRMKGQLSELGYSAEDIKQMTPTEASLLIDNEVSPADKAVQLPQLVKIYEEELAKQHEEAELLLAAQQEGENTTGSSSSANKSVEEPSKYTAPPRTPSSGAPSFMEQFFGSIVSKNVIDTPVEIASRTHLPPPSHREWYEVVEEYPQCNGTSETEVVALHPTADEAEVDANLRLEIMTKRAEEAKKDVTVNYTVRKTVR